MEGEYEEASRSSGLSFVWSLEWKVRSRAGVMLKFKARFCLVARRDFERVGLGNSNEELTGR